MLRHPSHQGFDDMTSILFVSCLLSCSPKSGCRLSLSEVGSGTRMSDIKGSILLEACVSHLNDLMCDHLLVTATIRRAGRVLRDFGTVVVRIDWLWVAADQHASA